MAVSKRLRYEILRRDNHTCRYCMTATPGTPLRVDHVVPVALGGTDDATNLVTSCEPCNSGKSSSAPDASLIASASDDQLRWALAMKQAAEAAATKRSEMDDYRSAFRKEWDQWTSDGKPFDLPGDWKITMDRFHNASLPAFMWDEIVTKAMTNQYVDDLFKYICGIAWNKVTELQDAARMLLKEATPTRPPRNEDDDEEWSLLADVLPCIGKDRFEAGLANIREVYEDEDLSETEINERAASWAIWALANDTNRLEGHLRRLLHVLPSVEVSAAQDAAEQLERRWAKPESAIAPARLSASTVEQLLHARADEATSDMTDAELAEWHLYAAASQGDDGLKPSWGAPTEKDLRRRAGEAALIVRAGWRHANMCYLQGEAIEACPQRSQNQISVPACADCGIPPASPEGLSVCGKHFELFLAGELCMHDDASTGRADV